jgi:hypothetical protein
VLAAFGEPRRMDAHTGPYHPSRLARAPTSG